MATQDEIADTLAGFSLFAELSNCLLYTSDAADE